jgi:hypothetical protein
METRHNARVKASFKFCKSFRLEQTEAWLGFNNEWQTRFMSIALTFEDDNTNILCISYIHCSSSVVLYTTILLTMSTICGPGAVLNNYVWIHSVTIRLQASVSRILDCNLHNSTAGSPLIFLKSYIRLTVGA